MKCPVCGKEKIRSYVLDEKEYRYTSSSYGFSVISATSVSVAADTRIAWGPR